jgi:primosomal protein N'
MILEVAIPLNVDKNFDYISDENVKIGCRAVVPFGKKKTCRICRRYQKRKITKTRNSFRATKSNKGC